MFVHRRTPRSRRLVAPRQWDYGSTFGDTSARLPATRDPSIWRTCTFQEAWASPGQNWAICTSHDPLPDAAMDEVVRLGELSWSGYSGVCQLRLTDGWLPT